MIVGIGLDVCEISRMEKNLRDDRFLNRYYTEGEITYIRSRGNGAAQTASGLFAAREALGKALGGGIDFDLKEAEICHDQKGGPYFRFTGSLAVRTSQEHIFVSITHDGGFAAAVVQISK